jgi:hypothetical protein
MDIYDIKQMRKSASKLHITERVKYIRIFLNEINEDYNTCMYNAMHGTAKEQSEAEELINRMYDILRKY